MTDDDLRAMMTGELWEALEHALGAECAATAELLAMYQWDEATTADLDRRQDHARLRQGAFKAEMDARL